MMMLTTLLFSFNAASAVVVIVNKSSSAVLDKKQISRIYLNLDKKLESGRPIIPIAHVSSSPLAAEFNKNVVGKSSSQYKAYWSKLIFTGKGTPPKEVDSDDEVIQLVANNPDLIGYVEKGSVTDDVKVIGEF
ncbi:phosphate ABC transporter substrate-binding protein [Vibrio ostreicida]|nr:phosphate ABC transporter substrate-binding protein [Vibrio ostreicida]